MAAMKIMLADEHHLVMEGIKLALEKYVEFTVIGTAQDGITLLERFKEQVPDVVLMELHMPRLGGLETCRLITRKYPQVRVIILTACQSDMYVGEAFRAGARGYISKTVTAHELAAALRTVYETGILIPPFAALHLLRAPARRNTAENGPLLHLTTREREILSLVVEGRTTHDIAGFFFISPKTVRNHLSHIYEKLGTRDRLQTILYMQHLSAETQAAQAQAINVVHGAHAPASNPGP